jgi:hypothetical protein
MLAGAIVLLAFLGGIVADPLAQVGTGPRVSTGMVRLADSSVSEPAAAFASDTDTGLARIAADRVGVVTGGGWRLAVDGAAVNIPSDQYFGWTALAGDASGPADTRLCRGGANVIGIGGCTSSFPALKRSGANGQMRLGDDSAFTSWKAAQFRSDSSAITAGSGTGVTVDDEGVLTRQVYKVTVVSTQFIAAATTADFTVATLPAKTILNAIYVDKTVAFACAVTCTSSTLSATVGSTAGGNGLIVSFDADAAAAVYGDADAELGTQINRASAIQGGFLGSWTTTTPVTMRLTSGTGNIGNGALTNLSQGTLVFYLVTERLP